MWTILFIILLFMVFGKLLLFSLKASWGILKLLVTVVFGPIVLLFLLIWGLLSLAFPLLLIIGICVFLFCRD